MKAFIDLFRIKKRKTDVLVAVTNNGYCHRLEDYSLGDRSFTIKGYNPRSPPVVRSYPSRLFEYNNISKKEIKDLQDLYIISIKKKCIKKPIKFIRDYTKWNFGDWSETRKIIRPIDVPYTKSKCKKAYIRILMNIANNI